MLYIKDTRVESLSCKLRLLLENITRIVNARVYEKGNALIFQLDRSLRQVRFYEDHIYVFEKELKEWIREEFRRELEGKDLELDRRKRQVMDTASIINQEVKTLILTEQKRIKKATKATARKMKDLDNY